MMPRRFLVGPTSVGKTAVLCELASRDPDLVAISMDSMQVYREMDIGTAKPTDDERARHSHLLLR